MKGSSPDRFPTVIALPQGVTASGLVNRGSSKQYGAIETDLVDYLNAPGLTRAPHRLRPIIRRVGSGGVSQQLQTVSRHSHMPMEVAASVSCALRADGVQNGVARYFDGERDGPEIRRHRLRPRASRQQVPGTYGNVPEPITAFSVSSRVTHRLRHGCLSCRGPPCLQRGAALPQCSQRLRPTASGSRIFRTAHQS